MKQPSEVALKIGNEIADQFTTGFCNDRMVEDFARIVDKHLKQEPYVWMITKTIYNRPPIVKFVDRKPSEQNYQYYKVTELYKGSND